MSRHIGHGTYNYSNRDHWRACRGVGSLRRRRRESAKRRFVNLVSRYSNSENETRACPIRQKSVESKSAAERARGVGAQSQIALATNGDRDSRLMFMELKDGETIKKHRRRSRAMKGRPTGPHYPRSTERGAASTFQVSQMDRRRRDRDGEGNWLSADSAPGRDSDSGLWS
jgi:hypothetical protein